MDIERKVHAVEARSCFKARSNIRRRACDGLQSRPEQTVVHDEKIDFALDGRIDRAGGRIDSSADPRHRARILELQAIQRVGPVVDLRYSKEVATVFDQLGQSLPSAPFLLNAPWLER